MPVPSSSSSSSSQSSSLRYDRDTGIVYSEAHRPLYQTIIGIEIHAQLDVPAKLFSSAPRTTTSNLLRHRRRHHLRAGHNDDDATGPGDGICGPNGSVHAYDLAYPGTLPAPPSRDVIHSAILACSALDCDILRVSRFERKHYFYPDLPSGYQITQQRWPLARDGLVTFLPHVGTGTASSVAASSAKRQLEPAGGGRNTAKIRRRGVAGDVDNKCNDGNNGDVDNNDYEASSPSSGKIANAPRPLTLRIERVQLEQDTGKTTTTITTEADGMITTRSYVDYNRAGCALIEVVSHPDLRSANEVAGAVERIRSLLRHVGSCDGRMEEGNLRCDLNVSIAPIVAMDSGAVGDGKVRDGELACGGACRTRGGGEDLPPNTGHRVEVKNLNSIRQIVAATEYEALRQSELAMLDSPTGRETRTFVVRPKSRGHPLGGETHCIRAKGDCVDYRFMPEPDLPPLILDEVTLGIEGGMIGEKSNDGLSLSLSSYCPIKAYVERFMPESIESARSRLVSDYGLMEDVAQVITSDPPAIIMFEEAVTFARSELRSMNERDDDELYSALPTMVANWLCNDLFALIKKSATRGTSFSGVGGGGREAIDIDDGINETSTLDHPISIEYSTVDSERLGALVAMVAKGTLTSSMAKKVLAVMFDDDGEVGGAESSCYSHPDDIAKRHGYKVISDWDALVQLCEKVVLDPQNVAQLEQYKFGDERKRWKINKFYVGKVMAASNGNAHPERMKEALAFVLDKAN
jgi:aspartyl-tRNA(Asn)/glutamyl-tRNA(Gln) amidotransferase subunit B